MRLRNALMMVLIQFNEADTYPRLYSFVQNSQDLDEHGNKLDERIEKLSALKQKAFVVLIVS